MCVSSEGFARLYSKLMHLQWTMSSIFDWEVCRLGMRDTLKRGTITVSGFAYFHKNRRFLWEKKYVSKTNLGSTIPYTYTSYNKYVRLCMVSEELRLNEIGLFRFVPQKLPNHQSPLLDRIGVTRQRGGGGSKKVKVF